MTNPSRAATIIIKGSCNFLNHNKRRTVAIAMKEINRDLSLTQNKYSAGNSTYGSSSNAVNYGFDS
jgi:hypothetical protein